MHHAILQGFYIQKQRGLQAKFFINHEKIERLHLCNLAMQKCNVKKQKQRLRSPLRSSVVPGAGSPGGYQPGLPHPAGGRRHAE